MVRRISSPGPFAGSASRRDVRFVANDRIDTDLFAGVVKLKSTVQVSMVGQRQRIHAMVSRSLDQFLDRARTIQQTVMAVAMEVNKRLFIGHQAAPSKAVGYEVRGEQDFKGSQTGWLSHEKESVVPAVRLITSRDSKITNSTQRGPHVFKNVLSGVVCDLNLSGSSALKLIILS